MTNTDPNNRILVTVDLRGRMNPSDLWHGYVSCTEERLEELYDEYGFDHSKNKRNTWRDYLSDRGVASDVLEFNLTLVDDPYEIPIIPEVKCKILYIDDNIQGVWLGYIYATDYVYADGFEFVKTNDYADAEASFGKGSLNTTKDNVFDNWRTSLQIDSVPYEELTTYIQPVDGTPHYKDGNSEIYTNNARYNMR